MDDKEVIAIAEGLSSCDCDLLTGNVIGWGAWITATYPGLVAKGLMQKTQGGGGMRVTNTPLGDRVAALIREKKALDANREAD